MSLERELRASQRVRQQRRMAREAYRPIWERIRNRMPVVFALQGDLRAFRVTTSPQETVARVTAGGGVLALESAARARWGCHLVNTEDVFAYVADASALQGLGDLVPDQRPRADAVFRPPHTFVVVGPLPAFDTLSDGTRVVVPERLLMEYVGFVGHRFDLLAALCACMDRER